MNDTAVPVVNNTVFQDNPYHALLYSGLGGRYACIRGSVEDALQLAEQEEGPALLHLHWEEQVIRDCPSAAEARMAARHMTAQLAAFRARGGRIAWTVHNAEPHEGRHLPVFHDLRRAIAMAADRILLHGTEALAQLEAQVGPVGAKAFLLPHPSYLGVYEPEATSLARAAEPRTRRLLAFGKVRGYKRLDRLAGMLDETFLAAEAAELLISGEPLAGDPVADVLAAAIAGRRAVAWDNRRVPEAELGTLFRSAAGAVLNYAQPLGSGVALLALGFGVPLVAPRLPALVELVPAQAQPFLFAPNSAADLRRAVKDLLALGPAEAAALNHACVERARHLHPRRISLLLGMLYDSLRGAAHTTLAAHQGA